MNGIISASGRGKAFCIRYRLAIVTFLCLFGHLGFFSLAYSLPPDPQGAHDFSEVDCRTNGYPGLGTVVATFDVKLVTDNTGGNAVAGYGCPVIITVTNNALVRVDDTFEGVLGGTPIYDWFLADVRPGPAPYDNPTQSPFHLVVVGGDVFGLAPGAYIMMHIRVEVRDSCTVRIDTLRTPNLFPQCAMQNGQLFTFAWGGQPGGGYQPGGKSCKVCGPTLAIGTGYGVGGDFRSHIDSYFNCSLYQLYDHTRQEIYKNAPGHIHNGRMPDYAYIITQKYLVGVLTDNDNLWNNAGQAAGVDAHVYASLTYDYMNLTLLRNGFDSLGSSMITIVDDARKFDQATFDTSTQGVIIFLPGPSRLSGAGSLDVVAHEWGHGIIFNSSKLGLAGEAGSLDESFSFMLGAAVEYAYEGAGSMWQINEDSYTNGSYDYDMANPHSSPLDSQPDTYGPTDPYWEDVTSCIPSPSNSYCWRHHNSGIPNKMFYLLSNGGSHNGVAVTGIGVEDAMNIMYLANKKLYWDSLTDFVHAATGSIKAAFDLNYFSSWPLQTSRAWTAVKVCTTMAGDVNSSGSITIGDAIHLVNYIFDKPISPCQSGCWPINPLCRGDVNGADGLTTGDAVWLVNYIFYKERPPCLNTNPTNCWLPIPRDVCCKLP